MKKLIASVLTAVLVATSMSGAALAAGQAEQQTDHQKRREKAIREIAAQFQDGSRDPYGYIGKTERQELMGAEEYPESFDLRSVDTDGDGEADTSYVTPVKLQNPFGSVTTVERTIRPPRRS